MNILADVGDMASFGFTLLFAICLPVVGIIASAFSLEKRGLNPKAAFSITLFFVAFLLSGISAAMSDKAGITSLHRFYCLTAAVGIHILSALLATWGLSEIRTHRKWNHGRQRSFWCFWVNISFIIALSAWFYLQVNAPLRHQLFD